MMAVVASDFDAMCTYYLSLMRCNTATVEHILASTRGHLIRLLLSRRKYVYRTQSYTMVIFTSSMAVYRLPHYIR